jgi:inner membrane protein
MASPVAHSFAGFWTFLLLTRRCQNITGQWLKRLGQLGMLVFVANLADFDFLPELISRKDFHRGFSHSLLAAALAAILFAGLWRIAGSFWTSAGIYFIAYASHLLIDFFTGLELGWNHSGSGIPLFWPWPTKDFGSLLVLDYGVRHGSLAAIVSLANLRAACYDLCLFGTITAVLLLWRARYVLKKPRTSSPSGRTGCLLHTEGAHPE